MTVTRNFDEMDDSWLDAIGKPVLIGIYSKPSDALISQLATTLLGVSFNPGGHTKIVGTGDSSGWFDPETAYGLITFDEGE